jgi:hypothetical protein
MKVILPILGLCIGLWSIPASAGPIDIPDHARVTRGVGRALRIHHVDADWRSPATLPSVVSVRIQGHKTPDPRALVPAGMQEGPRLRMDAPRRLSVVAGIPEPSSTTLFGVGVLVALQAIPRKSSLVPSDAAAGTIDRS